MIKPKWAFQAFHSDYDFATDGDHLTPEDAAWAGIDYAGDSDLTEIEVCEVLPVRINQLVHGAAEAVVENAQCRLEDTGYLDEDFLTGVDQAQLDDLESRIHSVFKHWLKRYKHKTRAWEPGKIIKFTFDRDAEGNPQNLTVSETAQPVEVTA